MKKLPTIITSLVLLMFVGVLSLLTNTGVLAEGIPTRNPHHPTGTPTATRTASFTPTQTPSPTETPSPTVHPSNTPVPTQTPTPHLLATATPSVMPTATPFGFLPLCATHDPMQYHALIKADGSCHYNHEHHNDPGSVNDLFGVPGAWFGGTSISYPWETFSPAGQENEIKHPGYKWIVRRNILCAGTRPDEGCVIAFRYQVHAMGTQSDTTARFHSYSVEAIFCSNADMSIAVCGIVRTGGWEDYGGLVVFNADGSITCPVIPSTPPGYICGDSPHRDTGHLGERPLIQDGWYGSGGIAPFTVETEPFGDTDPADPLTQHFRCPAPSYCGYNESVMRIENALLLLGGLNPNAGYGEIISFDGYLDRYGNVVQGCIAVSLDCIPTHVDPLPNVYYHSQAGAVVNTEMLSDDTDTSPANLGTGPEWYIQFPN